MYEIKKGIAIPVNARCGGRALYPFRSMVVGDCFEVPIANGNYRGKQASVIAALSHQRIAHKQLKDRKFVTHYIAEEDVLRVWRTE